MRKPIYLLFFTAFFLMSTGNLSAADLKDGFFDIAWKTNLSLLDGFRKISQNLNVAYFVNDQRAYKISDIKISDVVYGSFENQFFAVYIDTAAIDVFAQLKRYINHKYGLPQIKINQVQGAGQETVYQWNYRKTKIKLKMHENRENMKIAFYYTPLSAQVNEAQMETYEETHEKTLFPLDKTQMNQAEQLMDLMQF
jgi:uncharacterized protein YdgA (DUF945 family)